jgi:cobalt/nickel transport protein
MKYFKLAGAVIFIVFFSFELAFAHFGMAIPSDNMVMQQDARTVDITLSFSHPFEMIGMPLIKPESFFVYKEGGTQDLTGKLLETKVMEHNAWKTGYKIKRPGTYSFLMQPKAYWEPAEDCFIIHYTKTIVAAFGDDTGWDVELGVKTEIVPLSRPFGLYAGNIFQGIVKLNGNIVPFAQVEVEYYNREKKADAPSELMITQTIKADQNGVFSYAAPHSGWWGFAALNLSDKKMMHNNKEKDVELGAVLWVKFEDWQEN